LPVNARNASDDHDCQKPADISDAAAMGKKVERERPGSKKKHPNPNGPVGDPIMALIPLPYFPLMRIFDLHCGNHLWRNRTIISKR